MILFYLIQYFIYLFNLSQDMSSHIIYLVIHVILIF